MDESLGGVTAIGFVIAVFLKQGFVSDCPHKVATTGQPQDTTLVGDVTATTTAGSQGMASVSEYQQAQAAPIPGGINQPPGTTIV